MVAFFVFLIVALSSMYRSTKFCMRVVEESKTCLLVLPCRNFAGFTFKVLHTVLSLEISDVAEDNGSPLFRCFKSLTHELTK